MWTSPAIHLWTVRYGNGVATTVLLKVFTQRNFVADFFRQKLTFTGKNSKIAFCATLWGDSGVTYTVYLWLVEKCMIDFLLVLIELDAKDLGEILTVPSQQGRHIQVG